MRLKLMYITNNPDVALIAEKYGVDRVWVDLETLGKAERQKGMDTIKSDHIIEDIAKIKPLLTTSEMLVRVNPWNPDSPREIEGVIAAGADIIMLPMWKSPEDVKHFLETVRGRTKTTLLLETREAVECVDQVLEMGGFDEVHIGLNDLHLSYGMDFMFEPLANGLVESLCEKFRSRGIPYGFGGIAKIGEGLLPAEKVIMEHVRLGSTRAILSRTFCDNAVIRSREEIDRVFRINMEKLVKFEAELDTLPREAFLRNQREVVASVGEISEMRKARRK